MVTFSSGVNSPPPAEPTPALAPSTSPDQPLAIEAPPAADDTIKLDVSTSEPVSLFDKLGPTIVAKDGTLSRIGNWQEMDQLERARVLRVLGKRNEIRLTAKRAEDAAAKEQAQAGEEVKP